MAHASPLQNSFALGEVSPLMSMRTDFEGRKEAVGVLENFIPLVQGPATARPGTRHVKHAKYATTGFGWPVALVPFEFNTEQAYVLEFGSASSTGGGYMRVYKDGGPVLESALTVTGATQADPVVLTVVGHGLSANVEVYVSGVGGMTEINGRYFRVSVVDVDNIGLYEAAAAGSVDGTGFTAYTSGGTAAKVYEISTPYAASELFDSDNRLRLSWAQSADVLYLAHPSYTPRKLSRTAHTSWTLTEIDFQDGPYLLPDISGTTLTPSVTGGPGIQVTITASAATFSASDEGRLIRIQDSAGNWTWMGVRTGGAGYISSTQVSCTMHGPAFADLTARDTWRLGLYISGGTTAQNNLPNIVTFFEDRLFWGGTPLLAPQRLDGSRTADYENMAPTAADGSVVADHAVGYTLNSNTINALRWVLDYEKGLQAGTAGSPFTIKPAAGTGTLSAASPNAEARRVVAPGCAPVAPVRAGSATLFVHRSGRKVHELAYAIEADSLHAPDLTVLAEHITRPGVLALAWHIEPWSVVWAVRADGVLLGLTYGRVGGGKVGWHRHIIGGRYSENLDGNYDIAKVESIAVIPSPDGASDQLWLQVRRTVNGANVRHIEILETPWAAGDAQEDAFYVDSGATYDGTAASTITNLHHLEGETVSVVADGGTVPDATVTNGQITLDAAASVVQIGLPYVPVLEQLPSDAGSATGTAQGKKRRADRVTVLLYQTLGLWVGPDANTMDEVVFRSGGDLTDTPVPIFDGEKSVRFPGGYESRSVVRIEQRLPFPMTVLGIAPQTATQD